MENAISRPIIRESLRVSIRRDWSPPVFDMAFDYIRKCLARREELVLLGTLNGNRLEITIRGFVPCIGMGRTELKGQGIMSITRDDEKTELVIKVLGSISGFGTAVLIDENGDIWLYNPPDSLCPPLPDFPQKAVMILKKGETGGIHKVLMLDDCYDAVVEIVGNESAGVVSFF